MVITKAGPTLLIPAHMLHLYIAISQVAKNLMRMNANTG